MFIQSLYFSGFPLKFGIVIGGSLTELLFVVCDLHFVIVLKWESFCLHFSAWLKLVASVRGPIRKLIRVFINVWLAILLSNRGKKGCLVKGN